jgi:hypothetical protein
MNQGLYNTVHLKLKCPLTLTSKIEVYFPMYDYLGNAIFEEDLGIG